MATRPLMVTGLIAAVVALQVMLATKALVGL